MAIEQMGTSSVCCYEAVCNWEQERIINRDVIFDKDSGVVRAVLGTITLVKSNVKRIGIRFQWLDSKLDTKYFEASSVNQCSSRTQMMSR